MRRTFAGILVVTLAIADRGQAQTDLALLDEFSPGLGTLVSASFDRTTDRVWVYNSFGAQVSSYTREGTLINSIPRPGEAADDADMAVTTAATTLGSTPIPEGTLIFVNGETGPAEIYALDRNTGAVLATLVTAFGESHVVGSAYHPRRNTYFLVQDRQPSGTENDSIVAEIDPVSGSVLNSFQITASLSEYSINYGDIEVGGNDNLFVISSDELSIAEFTPAGVFVQLLALPAGVSSLSGLGFDNGRGETWVSGTGGTVWRLGGLPIDPTLVPLPAHGLACGLAALACLLARRRRRA